VSGSGRKITPGSRSGNGSDFVLSPNIINFEFTISISINNIEENNNLLVAALP
jgi:hypothetical protein